ncbi:hypothetical protein BURPS1710b_A2046 [Burkholderia pseudomallei 1710b]|uniref:Uncharacterized protein n=1 Tax=Burkholderia pseudomallei (strain 1710b) TaxID=320372 RepID=Q3JGV6_BURP1|nr:hypothetical protein BURPS1710b_A2046 [Burkholderia pseudomallei 1710b]
MWGDARVRPRRAAHRPTARYFAPTTLSALL